MSTRFADVTETRDPVRFRTRPPVLSWFPNWSAIVTVKTDVAVPLAVSVDGLAPTTVFAVSRGPGSTLNVAVCVIASPLAKPVTVTFSYALVDETSAVYVFPLTYTG